MKTTDQDTLLIKKAIRDHAYDVRLSRQLRKLPHNRQEWAKDLTTGNYRFNGPDAAGWVLCKIRSQQNGRVHHRYDPTVCDRLEALQSQLAYIESGLHHLPDDVRAAAERALAKVQWRWKGPASPVVTAPVTAPPAPVVPAVKPQAQPLFARLRSILTL